MTIKGGSSHQTVFNSVKIMMEKGMSVDQAIEEVESVLRGKLPDHIVAIIRQECQ